MSVRLTFRFSGEQQGLSEIVVELPSGPDAAAKVADANHVVSHGAAVSEATAGDQRQTDNPVEEGKDRRAVEANHRGVYNFLDIKQWGGRLGTAA